MKILEVNKFNYVQGGADKHFLDLVQLLKAKGNEVAVFSMESEKNEFSPWKKYFVSYVGYQKNDTFLQKLKGVLRMFYSFEARRKMKKLLEDFQPDIVHIHNIYHQISPSILSTIKKRNIPVVMTVHDYKLICPNYLLQCQGKNWEDLQGKKYLQFIKNRCFKGSYLKSFLVVLETKFHKFLDIYDKNIDLYISPSVFTKNKLVAGGIPAEKIVVQSLFSPANNFDEKSKIEISEKYILYFGQISKEKGVDDLVEIFSALPNLNLYLAGKKESGIESDSRENVKFLGFLNQRELERYIKNSLFVVSASRLPETFGLITLEAIKNGKPFVGYDAGAYKEIIENDKTGYLCQTKEEMREKIEKLAEDDGLRILFSRNALERAKSFDGNNYYRSIMEIFNFQIKNRERR